MENVNLILYLPLHQSSIIRQQNDPQQTDLYLWRKMEVCGHTFKWEGRTVSG
jgi:hypothetical protein